MISSIDESTPKNSEFYSQHIKNWQQSGISQEKYCKSVKISYSAFVYWRMKFLGKNRKSILKKQSTFLPVKSQLPPGDVKPTLSTTEYKRITVVTRNGTQLSFPLTIDPTSLGAYVKVLGGIS